MPFGLIVIGASWGGFAALRCILSSLPASFEVPIGVAQHRSPDSSEEGLTAALRFHSSIPVTEAYDKQPVDPGNVYVAPADYHLLVEDGAFALSLEQKVQFSRPSIDVLFESAADAYGSRLMAIVLTGSNQDGAAGVRRVRKRGGVTVAQDPATAERSEMPGAAVATGAVDHVLSLEDIGPFIAKEAGGGRGDGGPGTEEASRGA